MAEVAAKQEPHLVISGSSRAANPRPSSTVKPIAAKGVFQEFTSPDGMHAYALAKLRASSSVSSAAGLRSARARGVLSDLNTAAYRSPPKAVPYTVGASSPASATNRASSRHTRSHSSRATCEVSGFFMSFNTGAAASDTARSMGVACSSSADRVASRVSRLRRSSGTVLASRAGIAPTEPSAPP